MPARELKKVRDKDVAALRERLISPRKPRGGLTFDTPRLMGIVNVTPDSFSDGGRFLAPEAAVAQARRLIDEGAHVLDLGAESTRPGAAPVPAETQLTRLRPVLSMLRDSPVPLSVDTRAAQVMAEVQEQGVALLNDVSAFTHDPDALAVAARGQCALVLVHARTDPAHDPRDMDDNPGFSHVLMDVFDGLAERIAACEAAGISRDRLIVDPGLGFGKTFRENCILLENLAFFHGLGVPILMGASRKRFIGRLSDEPQPEKRLPGSVAAALKAVAQGVQILRIHDVAATRAALAVWRAGLLA